MRFLNWLVSEFLFQILFFSTFAAAASLDDMIMRSSIRRVTPILRKESRASFSFAFRRASRNVYTISHSKQSSTGMCMLQSAKKEDPSKWWCGRNSYGISPSSPTTRLEAKRSISSLDLLSSPTLLDPTTFFTTNKTDGTLQIPYPKALSPSSAAEFKACPQSYLFQYLLNIKQPTNLALAKGSMCHSALEQLYDLEPSERTRTNLHNLFRKNWKDVRLGDAYGTLFDTDEIESVQGDKTVYRRDIQAEAEWGTSALELLDNYLELEDPVLIPRPNPIERETWVRAKLTLDPALGATGTKAKTKEQTEDAESFLVRGIVDRLDYITIPPSPRDAFRPPSTVPAPTGAVRIIDYKTGKAPDLKYSIETNERIAAENMWQLKIYALLLNEMISNKKAYSKAGNLQNIQREDMRFLRLLYLTSVNQKALALDMDLGDTLQERNLALNDIHVDLSDIWKDIHKLVDTQDPKAFAHCDRKWCFCHKLRPKFIPGTLYGN